MSPVNGLETRIARGYQSSGGSKKKMHTPQIFVSRVWSGGFNGVTPFFLKLGHGRS